MLKFSIITVCYNSEKTIERTLRSVLCQTYTSIEYIIVDGYSTDATVEIIKKYASLFEKKSIEYKWISEKDTGIYDAMNKGVSMASGDYLNFLNSDDCFSESEVLQKVSQELSKTKSDVLCGAVNFIIPQFNDKKKLSYPHVILKKMFFGMRCPHQGIFYNKNIFIKIGNYDTFYKIIADQEHLLRIMIAGEKIITIPFIITDMYQGGISNIRTRESVFTILKEKRETLRKYYYPRYGILKTIFMHIFYEWKSYLYAMGVRNPLKQIYRYIKYSKIRK